MSNKRLTVKIYGHIGSLNIKVESGDQTILNATGYKGTLYSAMILVNDLVNDVDLSKDPEEPEEPE